MNDNWAEVRRQLDHVLAAERTQRQARRQQRPSWAAVIWQWLSHTLLWRKARTPSQAGVELTTELTTARIV